jgi:iron complex outermembrane receptor protein
VAAIAAILVPAEAFAQDAAQPGTSSDVGLEEIVVTAQKRAENLQSTPLAISALSAEAIEARSITSVANLAAIAPSLTVARGTAGPTNASVFIRGIGNQDPILTADSPVALYVDGIILARSAGSAFEMADLERIEVLRGPQGTLYGRNAVGGAINLITRKPSEQFGVQQKFTLGNYGEFQSRTVVDTGDLGDTGLRAAFTYMHKQRNGYVDDVNAPDRRDPGAYRTDGLRAALTFDEGGSFRASYAYDYNRNKGYPAAFQLTAARPDIVAFFAGSPAAGGGTFTVSPTRLDRIALDHNGAITDKVQGHTLTLELDIGSNTTLKSLTSYRKWRQRVTDSDLDGNAGLLGPIIGQSPTTGSVELFGASALRRQHQWSQELNLIGKIDATLDYVLGAYYFNEQSEEANPQRFSVILPSGALPRASLLIYDHESTTKALFAQGTWHATDRLNLTGGARYTWDEKTLNQVAPVVRDLDRSFKKFNWAATIDYKINDNVMAYARAATGYKAGGFNARSFDTGFDPEDLTSYEVGLKTELFDRRLRFNATAYYADHKDVQVTSFQAGVAGATAVTLNAGKARYKGIEIEVNAAPVRGLTTYATFGYVDRQYKEFLFFDTATGQTLDLADVAYFPQSASTTFNAGAKYEFPEFSFGKLAAQVDYNYMSKRYFNPNPLSAPFSEQMAAAPRGLVDARLTLSELSIGSGNLTLSIWGKNITDKKYKVVGIDFGQLGFAGNIYGEPASYGLDLGVKF